jgi:hypothetical protein
MKVRICETFARRKRMACALLDCSTDTPIITAEFSKFDRAHFQIVDVIVGPIRLHTRLIRALSLPNLRRSNLMIRREPLLNTSLTGGKFFLPSSFFIGDAVNRVSFVVRYEEGAIRHDLHIDRSAPCASGLQPAFSKGFVLDRLVVFNAD